MRTQGYSHSAGLITLDINVSVKKVKQNSIQKQYEESFFVLIEN